MQLKKTGYSVFPWGPESTVNGAQYMPSAKAFKAEVAYGQVFSSKELLAKARELAPELFDTREERDLSAGEVATRLNQGGKHPALGEEKFRLEWFPIQRVYCVIDASDLVVRVNRDQEAGLIRPGLDLELHVRIRMVAQS